MALKSFWTVFVSCSFFITLTFFFKEENAFWFPHTYLHNWLRNICAKLFISCPFLITFTLFLKDEDVKFDFPIILFAIGFEIFVIVFTSCPFHSSHSHSFWGWCILISSWLSLKSLSFVFMSYPLTSPTTWTLFLEDDIFWFFIFDLFFFSTSYISFLLCFEFAHKTFLWNFMNEFDLDWHFHILISCLSI